MNSVAPIVNQKEEKIWYDGDSKIPRCKKNLGQYLLDAMLKHKDRIAQIDPVHDITITHGQIRELSIRCALRMRLRGLKKSDVIMVCGRNHHLMPIPILGALYLGVPVNILHPNYSTAEFKHMLELVRPRTIICDEEVETKIEKLVAELEMTIKVITFEGDFFSKDIYQPTTHEDVFVAEKLDPSETTAFIMCTSGSTGRIKGVNITHSGMYAALFSSQNGMFVPDVLQITFSPLCWISGLMIFCYVLFYGGRKIVCEYDSDLSIKILKKYKGEWILYSPSAMVELTNHPEFIKDPTIAHQFKYVLFGGGPSTKQQCEKYRQIFKNAAVYNLYASTEMIQLHAIWSLDDNDLNIRKVNSQGKVPVGCYWKIRDVETGKMLGNNEKGELLIKGPTMMKGYYNDAEATANAIDGDGFYHTGDLVVVDDDDCLFHVGRCKETLKYKSVHISPVELESILLSHQDVLEACVVGKSDPEMMGDLAAAVVVKKTTSKLREEDLHRLVNAQVSDGQKLRGGIHFVTKLPKNPTGKVQRRLVQEMVAQL